MKTHWMSAARWGAVVLALAWQTSSADELVTGNLSLFRPSRKAIDFNPGEWRTQPIYDGDAPQARGDDLLGLPHLPSAVDLIGGWFGPLRRRANAASHGNQLDYSMLERGTHDYQESLGARRDQKQEGRNKRLTARLSWSAALTVVCGSAAWWSSEQAERAYRRYLQAAGVRRQQRQFSRARQFDRLAGAAFIGMEAGVALVTWQLFY